MVEGGDLSAASRSRSSQSRAEGLVASIRSGRSFRGRGRLAPNRCRVCACAGVRFFFDADQTLIGNLPAEVPVLPALLEALLEENGAAGIGNENSRGRQENISGAILHFHTSTEKGRVTSHPLASVVSSE